MVCLCETFVVKALTKPPVAPSAGLPIKEKEQKIARHPHVCHAVTGTSAPGWHIPQGMPSGEPPNSLREPNTRSLPCLSIISQERGKNFFCHRSARRHKKISIMDYCLFICLLRSESLFFAWRKSCTRGREYPAQERMRGQIHNVVTNRTDIRLKKSGLRKSSHLLRPCPAPPMAREKKAREQTRDQESPCDNQAIIGNKRMCQKRKHLWYMSSKPQ